MRETVDVSPYRRRRTLRRRAGAMARRRCRPLLITGAAGTLGRAVARGVRSARARVSCACTPGEVDIADCTASVARVRAARRRGRSSTAPDSCASTTLSMSRPMPREQRRGAARSPRLRRRGIQLVTFSSDLVFDGTKANTVRRERPRSAARRVRPSKARWSVQCSRASRRRSSFARLRSSAVGRVRTSCARARRARRRSTV